MSLPSCPLSYSAGSTGWGEPYGFRVVNNEPNNWSRNLVDTFPDVAEFFGPKGFVLNAYPATLGLTGFCPSVDSYLHPATFFRALHLASLEDRHVLLAAQPLVGADLLLRATQERIAMPKRILWGIGGYHTPVSLEAFIRSVLKDHGVEVRFLYSFGMAEVGHSLLCATARFPTSEPIYQQISDQIQLRVASESRLEIINKDGKSFYPGDLAEQRDEGWLIRNSLGRFDLRVRDELESWGDSEWERRTGYLHASDDGIICQLRDRVRIPRENELCHHIFWHHFGGSFTMKPKWGWHTT